MANTAADIQKLYIAYFNRPADPAGLDYWTKSNMSITAIANSFAEQAEYKAAFAAQSTETIVSTLYVNMFGRTADAAGFSYWVGEILSGRSTLGSAAINILNGAKDADKIAIDSKVTAAASFTTALNETDEMVAYSKAGGTAAAKVWLGAVSTAATATSQIAAQDAVIKSIVEGAIANNVLTNVTDIMSGSSFSAPQVYTPGGDDRINSLQDEDVLTGTSAKNTLTATLGNSNDNGATTITPTLNNMDVVNVAFTGSGADAVVNLDLQDATRVSEVNISRISSISNTARVENIQSVASKMSAKNSNANNAGAIEFSFGTDVLKGDNAGTLEVSNVQVGAIHVGQNIATGATGVNSNSYETLTLNSVGTSNTIGTLNLPMDTGTAGKVVITGDKNLNLSTKATINSATVTTNVEATTFAGGITGANGRLAAIDASAFTADLTLTIGGGTFTTGKADTSGADQNVTITGGKGNDTFYLADEIQTGDSLTGGDGTDTLVVVAGGNIKTGATGSSIITKVEALQVLMDGASSTVDFDKLPDVTGVTVRNIGNNGTSGATKADVAFTLSNLTAAQGTAITVLHSTTGNGDVTQTTVNANLKTAGTVGVTIKDGVNTDNKFGLTINAGSSTNLTITDSDTESNMVEVASGLTGTVTVKGGTAGKFINFDVDTAAVAGATTGLKQANIGQGTDGTGVRDVSLVTTQVKFASAVFDASGEASDVTARFSTNAASAQGAQKVTMGTGNDFVIFDNLNDTTAGLNISDSVDGGTGDDTLVIDGNLTSAGKIALSASEWTNVKNFETIHLVGAGTGSSYELTLTDALIAANNKAGMLAIVNDNGQQDAALGNESAVVIDGMSLTANSKFSYDGEEHTTRTTDRIILKDAGVNGSHIIDGGSADLLSTTFAANADVLEIRNNAVATLGDLANIKNIGKIAFNNDQAVAQKLTLQLDANIVNAFVDSLHTASITEREVLNVVANEGLALAGFTSVAAAAIDLDARSIGDTSVLTFTGDTAIAGADTLRFTASMSAGAHTVNAGLGIDLLTITGGAATTTLTTTASAVLDAAANLVFTSTLPGVTAVTWNATNWENIDATGFLGTLAFTASANTTSIVAGEGADTIVGGAAVTTLGGAGGNDTLTGGNATGTVNGGEGNDTISGVYIQANGDAGNDTIGGTTVSAVMNGGDGSDTITGGAATQTLNGGAGADTIVSGAFVNTINGGDDVDAITLSAGTAQTVIVGNTAASADNITTFTVAGEDKIQLSKALFAAVTSVAGAGFSVGTEFLSVAGGVATTAAQRIIYNSTTGAVTYDADGNGAGAAVLIATLVGAPALVATDFTIVA